MCVLVGHVDPQNFIWTNECVGYLYAICVCVMYLSTHGDQNVLTMIEKSDKFGLVGTLDCPHKESVLFLSFLKKKQK